MFNLSQKAAKHFKESFSNLDGRIGNFWRLDIVYINRKKILMCVHEPTLYTHLFHGTDFKTLRLTSDFLKELNPWYDWEISMGKGMDRRVTGSMTDMKNMMKFLADDPKQEVEDLINRTPFSYIGYDRPKDALEEFLDRQS